jgi:hypothetical protein
MISRRDALRTMGGGFGMLACADLLGSSTAGPLEPRSPHFAPKAKHVIYLFLNGGPSQVDTFDPKPMLTKYHGKPMPTPNLKSERKTGNLLASPFEFKRHGKSGLEVSEIFPLLGDHADELCVIRSMYTERPNHEPSLFMLNCGHTMPGRPSLGAWLTYGLGTPNQNLPGFVVLCPGLPVIGPQLWSAAFLPAVHQGTYVPNNEKEPDKLVPNVRNAQLAEPEQRKQLDLLARLNRLHGAAQGPDPELEASIQSSEIAFHMQREAPEVFDLSKESERTRERYGDGDFARGCLMAARLVERGVRMVQVYFGNGQPWDNHDDIQIHRRLAGRAERPIAALLAAL